MSTPSRHELAAAIQVARFIDAPGNDRDDAHGAYRTTPTSDSFAPETLRIGEGLLLEAGLLILIDGRLVPTAILGLFIANRSDEQAATTLAQALAERADSLDRGEAGAAGEEFVLARARSELDALHRPDLSVLCERVSLISDWYGYDVTAPMLTGQLRRLEVKTMSSDGPPASLRFFISRNEYDTGRRNPEEWALVACARARATGEVSMVGWCRASTLTAYLPADQGGRWTEAAVQLPVAVLNPGLPAAV